MLELAGGFAESAPPQQFRLSSAAETCQAGDRLASEDPYTMKGSQSQLPLLKQHGKSCASAATTAPKNDATYSTRKFEGNGSVPDRRLSKDFDVPQHYSITPQISWQPGQEINEDRRGTVEVELQKKEGCGLGLTISGGVDKNQRPHVSNLRPGSIAHRCDALLVGDYIVSVNGIRTANLRHEEIINLLKNAGTNVTLEIEYEIPDSGLMGGNLRSNIHEIVLDKELSGFGLTLRGGMLVDRMKAHPLTVVSVRPGGPGDREGSIRVGDRVIAINGYKVAHLTLTETLSLFAQCDSTALFTMSYDVAVLDAVENASGPLLIEISRIPGTGLGLSLSQTVYEEKSCLCVDSIQAMTNADRSGALHPGDCILAIDGACVESMSVAEASQLLRSGTENYVQLEIIPFSHLEHCNNRDILTRNSLATSFTSHSGTILSSSVSIYSNLPHHSLNKSNGYNGGNDRSNSRLHSFSDNSCLSVGTTQFGTLNMRKRTMWMHGPERRATSCMSIASSSTSVLGANNQVCHTETVEVILFADHKGLGITLKGGIFSTAPLLYPPTIASIDLRSAADMCGVLQEGDRVLTINGMETVDRTLEENNHFLRESRPRCVLLIEFDVTESVQPSSGTYVVKLAKKSGDTGITVSCTPSFKSNKDALFISDVRRGSVSHRTGSIQSGDKLLAINDVRLDICTPEDAMHLLELPDDIVKLKLQRDDPDEGNEGCIIYTVELQRFGGPLGITISGTEDPLDPIIISELTPYGLADRTGAIHVGDRLLAVSGSTTKNKPLSEAIRMLQSAGDLVTLKIARPESTAECSIMHMSQFALGHGGKSSTTIPSVDSALESWSSSAHDIVASGNSQHDNYGVMVMAVPNSAGIHQKTTANNSSHFLPGAKGQSSHNWDDDSENSSSSKDPGNENDSDDVDTNSNSQMDDWVKTLEEFDMGSGSEMLRQIGLSLRQRSVMSLDRKTNPENIIAAMQQQRSKSTCRVEDLGSKIAEGRRKPAVSDNKLVDKPAIEAVITPRVPNHEENKAKSCGALYSKLAASAASSPGKLNRTPSQTSKSNSKNNSRARKDQIQTVFTPHPVQLQRIVLEKSWPSEDFGFSISDGLHEKGVYVSAVKDGSLAEKSGLRPFDRILQVDKVKTRDFDCRLTVPMISYAGKRLSLIVCRNPLLPKDANTVDKNVLPLPERRKLNKTNTISSPPGRINLVS